MNTIAERATLRLRLDDGWQLIADAVAAGKDVSSWDTHWDERGVVN